MNKVVQIHIMTLLIKLLGRMTLQDYIDRLGEKDAHTLNDWYFETRGALNDQN